MHQVCNRRKLKPSTNKVFKSVTKLPLKEHLENEKILASRNLELENLQKENTKLTNEITELKKELLMVQKGNTELMKPLTKEITELREGNTKLTQEIAELRKGNTELTKEMTEATKKYKLLQGNNIILHLNIHLNQIQNNSQSNQKIGLFPRSMSLLTLQNLLDKVPMVLCFLEHMLDLMLL